MSKPDIIYFTLFPWDNAYSSVSLSFTREFAKHGRVFYINHPYTIKDFVAGRKEPMVKARSKAMLTNRMRYEEIPELPDNVIAVQPPLVIPNNFLQPGKLYDRLWRYNHRVILDTVNRVIKDYDLKDYIYLNCFNPFFGATLPRPEFRPLLNMYQCIDDMYEEEYTAKHAAKLEERVLAEADVAIVTSRNLKKLKKHLNPKTHILHNAVDTTIFERAVTEKLERPAEIKDVTTPIIGFTGNINEYRLDYPLFKRVAVEHPDKTLVLVGPLNSDDYKTHGLDQLPNVILTGGKHITELPAFLQHFDCTIIPFQCNRLTASVYPLKINEYLAAGKAVVSTAFSEDIRTFEKDIYLAEDHDAFVRLIDRAVTENDPQRVAQRTATAASNNWTNRVREFWEIVERYVPALRLMDATS